MRALSVLPAELPAAIERLQADGKELRRQIKDFQSKLAAQEADALAAGGAAVRGVRLVLDAIAGWDAAGLKTIAARIVERPGHVVVLVGIRARGYRRRAVGRLCRTTPGPCSGIVQRHGGKGGGRPELAQGGGITAPPAAVLEHARELVARPS